MELVTRMHRTLREAGRNFKIAFIPDPVAWTEVTSTLRVLRRQRDRWHRGLIDALLRHRKVLLNLRYGSVGVLAMPYYYFIFELLGPAIQLVGYIFLAVGLVLGVLNLEFAVAFFRAAVGLGALLSISAHC
jgi:cellulose synthase/poly-beta-1,6-N-acetylglucosamine synthase-like glycosyltransferase